VSKRWVVVTPLLACLGLGCNRGAPAPAPARPPPTAKKAAVEVIADDRDETTKRLDAAEAALEQLAVSFVIDGVRDAKHQNDLFAEVRGLKDAEAKNGLARAGAGYAKGDRYFRVSPISDIAATASKVDFGLVVAVDPVARVILIDASAKPAPPPEKGWPGAQAIDRYIARHTAAHFERVPRDLIKQFGRGKVVAVCLPFPGNDRVLKKLSALAPATYSAEYFPGSGPHQKVFMFYPVAPIDSVSDVVKVLDEFKNLTVDEERRVIIVDLPSLRPRPAP